MRTEAIARPFHGATTNWTYVPSQPRLGIVLRRWRARLSRRPAPAWRLCRAPSTSGRWLMYFMFLPDGQLSPHHRFTLERLRAENVRLMIVCTCPDGHPVLQELLPVCDALCWKALAGYDFSGYAVGLSALAQHAPGSDVMVLNDSMLGPFKPLAPFIEQAPWDLTGFTANAQNENHLQSYSFILKGLDDQTLAYLKDTLSTSWRYDKVDQVILLQETRLARVASHHMSVGAYWYTDGEMYEDLCLNCPVQLLEAGFPLLKRSLFGKFAGIFQDPQSMRALLQRLGHPPLTSPR